MQLPKKPFKTVILISIGGDIQNFKTLLCCYCAAMTFVYAAFAQQAGLSVEQELAGALNAEGKLKRGAEGSFSAAGFRMICDPNGEPRFLPNSPPLFGDDNWDEQFNLPGTNDWVRAIAVSGNDIYVGGSFTTVEKIVANRIAKWNGTSWSALGDGLNNTVYTLAVSGSDIYVGGSFTTAGGTTANRIAKWNGTSWSALGSGTSDDVHAIAISGNDVYA
ncbi:MAG: hypothetical protein AAB393_14840, partial [Bacteroidota bacterium]